MACDMLNVINHEKDSWKVKVRVIRLWDAINLNTNELISLDMILIDEEGTMIHGKVWKHQVNKFKPLIQEGSVYMIANFKVSSAANYRPVEGDTILNFMHTTKIQEIKDLANIAIAEQSFRFSSIKVLSTRDGEIMYLSDVIGVATYIGHIEETQTTHGISKIRDIVLQIEDQRVNVRLWGEKVKQINEDSPGRVVIVTSTIVRKLKEYSLSSTSATRVYVDLDIPETIELQKRYLLQDNIIEERQLEAHLKGTIQEQMLYNRRTLQEITEITYESEQQEKFYTAEATIKSVNTSDEWYYIGCGKCSKKVEKQANCFYCPRCQKEPEKTSPRYRLKLEICDRSTTTTCTMFETEAKKLINQSARFLIDTDDYDIHEKTKQIQKICGERLIFQFRLDDYNLKYGYQDYTVYRIFFIEPPVLHANIEQVLKKVESDGDFESTIVKQKLLQDDVDCSKEDETSLSKKHNHQPIKKVQNLTTIKQEPKDYELTVKNQSNGIIDCKIISNDEEEHVLTKRNRTRSTRRVVHLDEESETEGSVKKNESRFKESRLKRKRTIAGVGKKLENNLDDEPDKRTEKRNDSKPKRRQTCVDKKPDNKPIQKPSVSRTRKPTRKCTKI